MIKAVLLGVGNLGHHLANAMLECAEIELVQVYNRNRDSIDHLKSKTSITTDPDSLLPADVYFLCVPDSVVVTLSKKIPEYNQLVVHTSGCLPMKTLKNHKRYGVFYPVQSFSKEIPVEFSKIPICIEAAIQEDENFLKTLAFNLSDTCHVINSDKREKLHLAAVYVNNFVNHLFHIAHSICENNEVPFDLLKELIHETARKINFISPQEAQTGPARRNDLITIEKHVHLLSDKQKELYQLLTKSILKSYGN